MCKFNCTYVTMKTRIPYFNIGRLLIKMETSKRERKARFSDNKIRCRNELFEEKKNVLLNKLNNSNTKA